MRRMQFVVCAAFVAGLVSSVLADQPLQQRLERLAERLEEQRQAMNIPGMAIAVVKDDQVIMARGFGQRDLDNDLPADEHTLFAIGSSTKAFTAALIAMLVDEGRAQWDDPIRTHLPEFGLHNEEVAAQVTLRDALCHRSGLNRTDLLWISGNADRAEILQAITQAELYSPFREKWHYNNIMFLAAGEASARMAGTDWDSLLAERIFKPLGMAQANSTYAEAQRHPRLSKGYLWDKDREDYKRLPMRNIDSVAPAGSINASVTDMAQWVRLQLNRGEIDGKRLISEEQIEEMWTSCMDVAPTLKYGLGWFIQEWQGKRVVEHGGNIDGFAASVSLLPDENVGFVLLTNVSHSPLQALCHALVYDTLLGDADEVDKPLPTIDLRRYAGRYFFAPMDSHFEVSVKGSTLAVDVPGQTVYELKLPDDDGKWYFALTDQIAVSFELDEQERPVAMKLYQAGLTFELPREGVESELKVNMDQAGPLLGSYRAEQPPMTVRVLIQNGRLAIDVPGQMVYELHQPDDEGRWVFRATDAIYATFELDEDPPVLVMHQAGVATRFERIGGEQSAELPSVDDLLALVARGHNTPAAKNIQTLRIVEDVRMIHQGITGTVTTLATSEGAVRQDLDLGRFGYIHMAVVGDAAWLDSDIQPAEGDLSSEQKHDMRMRHPLALLTDWREAFDTVEVLPNETVDDATVHVVRLTAGSVRRTLRINAESGMIVSEDYSTLVPGLGRYTQKFRYEAYHDVNGVKLPARTVAENDLMGTMHGNVTEVRVNQGVSQDDFAMP